MNTKIKVAVVSQDGISLDTHFGQAENFIIYIQENGVFVKDEVRPIPEKTIHPAQEGGRSGGCCFRDEAYLEKVADTIKDCEHLLINKIGNHPSRILQREGVFILEAKGNIDELLNKLAQYRSKRS